MTEKYIMSENKIPYGILHDQNLDDISFRNNELTLSFEIHFYPQNYTDTAFAEKYKDFKKCQIKCTLEDRYFCNAVLKTTLDKNDNYKAKYLSIEKFAEIAANEINMKNKNPCEYLNMYISPGINSALIELSVCIKYKRVNYSMCTLELNTKEIEFIWE